jgi:nitroreductase
VDLEQVLRGRRSTRAFRGDPVPDEVVREILDAARWAPSWANSQAWHVAVVSGDTLRALEIAMSAKASAGVASKSDIPMPVEWPEDVKKRMSARRPAVGGRSRPAAGGMSVWEAWGAPTLLLFAIDERLAPEYACFDTGLLVQSVCLAAHDKGIGTCIEALMVRYPEVLHELLPETAHLRFVVAVALGYSDEKSPANSTPRERIGLDEFVTWAD